MIALARICVIASQALFPERSRLRSIAFSRLLPECHRHTSHTEHGHLLIPSVNRALMVGALSVFVPGDDSLVGTYGIAVPDRCDYDQFCLHVHARLGMTVGSHLLAPRFS